MKVTACCYNLCNALRRGFLIIFLLLIGFLSFAQAPVAAFSATPVSGCSPLLVAFTDQSTGAATWQWDLGNGVISTEATPSFDYQMHGIYTITLKVKDNKGNIKQTSKNITVLCIFGGIAHDF